MLELEFAQLSDPGKVRAQNEDFIGYAEPRTPEHARNQGWLFALADGCGGHDRGEVASRIAVDTLVSNFYANSAGKSARSSLEELVQGANVKICEFAATARPGGSAIDGRATRHEGYQVSQRKRKRIEEVTTELI